MKRGFYAIMAAQFFSSLADNALLIAAIAYLVQMQSPSWMTPALKLFFVLSYVLLAPFVGAFADSLPKGKVMLATNSIKLFGCCLMLLDVHPLLAYAFVGLGAAAYSPAKYGILTELLPTEKLVAANGWIEGLTVLSIILGTVLCGYLISPDAAMRLLSLDLPAPMRAQIDTPAEAAISVIAVGYLLAALCNLRIPHTGACYKAQKKPLRQLLGHFMACNRLLWQDPWGQISLAVTTLFWGAGAALQFIVLKWAEAALGLPLDQAAMLQGICAIGVIGGAVVAARSIDLRRTFLVIPLGIGMGLVTMMMTQVSSLPHAYVLLIVIGALSGFFIVPMNALLQHRGHVLMSAGHSIAVQNFNENLSILVMLSGYAWLMHLGVGVNTIIMIFGGLVAGIMILMALLAYRNSRKYCIHHMLETSRKD